MTYSSVAALVLRRMILKGETPYIKLFDPNRIKPVAGFTSFIRQNVDVLRKFVGKWFDKEKLEEFASKFIPNKIETLKEIGKGNPPDAILELVKRESVDLIVMGTHGYTGYQKLLLGSVTNNVLHRCTVPV